MVLVSGLHCAAHTDMTAHRPAQRASSVPRTIPIYCLGVVAMEPLVQSAFMEVAHATDCTTQALREPANLPHGCGFFFQEKGVKRED